MGRGRWYLAQCHCLLGALAPLLKKRTTQRSSQHIDLELGTRCARHVRARRHNHHTWVTVIPIGNAGSSLSPNLLNPRRLRLASSSPSLPIRASFEHFSGWILKNTEERRGRRNDLWRQWRGAGGSGKKKAILLPPCLSSRNTLRVSGMLADVTNQQL